MKMNHQLLDKIFSDVLEELARAEKKRPKWPATYVKQAAIVAEEAGELIKAALEYEDEAKPFANMEKEALQTMAMSLRFLLNL